MSTKSCKKCGVVQPINKDYFGHMPSGGFRGTCRKCMAKHVAKHSEQNPEMVRDRMRERVKRVQENSDTTLSPEERERIKKTLFSRQNSKCFFCKVGFAVHEGELEHLTPVAKGGGDDSENLVFSCFQCNREKHNKTLAEYRFWKLKNGYRVLF